MRISDWSSDVCSSDLLDTLIIPGGVGLRTAGAEHPIDRWLRDQAPRIRRVASVCTGAYALARAGLLDGRRATTHWRYAQDLQARFQIGRASCRERVCQYV